jgi:acyl carrier protein
MTNREKLIQAFCDALGVNKSLITDEREYNSISEWDSVAHMVLINKLEQVFDIMLDTDDIITMSTPKKAQEIVARHGVKF